MIRKLKTSFRHYAASSEGRMRKSRIRSQLARFFIPLSLTRSEKLLLDCNLSGVGLEIGPSYKPIAPKRLGYRVETLDHACADELREKYRDAGVDITRIEEVDYVWSGQPLDQLTGKSQHYDWIIASHVIEHTTDLVSFLQQCESLLKTGGILSLAVPDYRYCFDVFRPASTPGDVLQAYLEKRKRHSFGAVWDHHSLAATLNGRITWSRKQCGDFSLVNETLDVARKMLKKARSSNEYLDVHNWRFTPGSFLLVLHDIRTLGFSGLDVKQQFPVKGCEFIVQLQKVPVEDVSPDPAERMQYILDTHTESLLRR